MITVSLRIEGELEEKFIKLTEKCRWSKAKLALIAVEQFIKCEEKNEHKR